MISMGILRISTICVYLHQKSAHFTKISALLCQISDLRPVFTTALENDHSAKM